MPMQLATAALLSGIVFLALLARDIYDLAQRDGLMPVMRRRHEILRSISTLCFIIAAVFYVFAREKGLLPWFVTALIAAAIMAVALTARRSAAVIARRQWDERRQRYAEIADMLEEEDLQAGLTRELRRCSSGI